MNESNFDLEDRTLSLDTPAALTTFCNKYTPYVIKALYAITLKRPIHEEIRDRPQLLQELIKDATTDALVWAIDHAHYYDPQKAAVRTWLVAGAQKWLWRGMANEAKRLRQEDKGLTEAQTKAQLVAEPTERPEERLDSLHQAQEIEGVLGRLRGKQAQALLLSDYYDFSMAEVAAALDLPTADAASSLVRRARASFRRISKGERIPF